MLAFLIFPLLLFFSAPAFAQGSGAEPATPGISVPPPDVRAQSLYESPVFMKDGVLTLRFAHGQVFLVDEMNSTLSQRLLTRFKNTPSARIAIYAYAQSDSDGQDNARRLSFARALQVRDFLLAQGLEKRDILLYPLGNHSDGGAVERVDILIQSS